jgi:hypothetical protein
MSTLADLITDHYERHALAWDAESLKQESRTLTSSLRLIGKMQSNHFHHAVGRDAGRKEADIFSGFMTKYTDEEWSMTKSGLSGGYSA